MENFLTCENLSQFLINNLIKQLESLLKEETWNEQKRHTSLKLVSDLKSQFNSSQETDDSSIYSFSSLKSQNLAHKLVGDEVETSQKEYNKEIISKKYEELLQFSDNKTELGCIISHKKPTKTQPDKVVVSFRSENTCLYEGCILLRQAKHFLLRESTLVICVIILGA